MLKEPLKKIMHRLVKVSVVSQRIATILLDENEQKAILTLPSGEPTDMIQKFAAVINKKVELVEGTSDQYRLMSIHHNPDQRYYYVITPELDEPTIIETTMPKNTFDKMYKVVKKESTEIYNDATDVNIKLVEHIESNGFTGLIKDVTGVIKP